MTHRIRNYEVHARTPSRRDAMDIIEAGLAAIDTQAIMHEKVRLDGEILTVAHQSYNLADYEHIHVIGFGKASCQASSALEQILGNRIASGIALTNKRSASAVCSTVKICESTHPLPTDKNVANTQSLVDECGTISANDLVIVLVSGGGSAMLCWPASECEQGVRLYHAANKKGLTIQQLNIIRKHISALKGGGLAKMLYPAKVIGIVFSDVPGDAPDMVASGPTYPDASTVAEAQSIIDTFELGSFDLLETPKEPKWFENVDNFVLVSNEASLQAMAKTAQHLGYGSEIIASDMYDEPEVIAQRFLSRSAPHTVILGGGESRLTITTPGGDGGRNQHVALTAATHITGDQLFASIASDGLDNGESAGALVDATTVVRARAAGIDTASTLQAFNEHPLLTATDDLVVTGPTGANVSDLMFLLIP